MVSCNGKHNLVEITRNSYDHDAEEVVRWCSRCGAVVVDIDLDNRTFPGRIMKMKFPLIAKELSVP